MYNIASYLIFEKCFKTKQKRAEILIGCCRKKGCCRADFFEEYGV
jgi:hypothetical protein